MAEVLTHSDVVGASRPHQAVSGGDDPALAEDGTSAEYLSSGPLHQGCLGDGKEKEDVRTHWAFSFLTLSITPTLNTCHGISPGITTSPPTMRVSWFSGILTGPDATSSNTKLLSADSFFTVGGGTAVVAVVVVVVVAVEVEGSGVVE